MYDVIAAKMKRDGITGTKAKRKITQWYHPDAPIELRCPFHGIHLIDGGTCPRCKREGRRVYDYSDEDIMRAEMWKKIKGRHILNRLPKYYPTRI